MSFDINGPKFTNKPMIQESQNMQNNGGGGNLGYFQQDGEKKKKEEKIDLFETQDDDSFELKIDEEKTKDPTTSDKIKSFVENLSRKAKETIANLENNNPFK